MVDGALPPHDAGAGGVVDAPATSDVGIDFRAKGRVSHKIREAIARKRQFYSLEFFPPHTVDGARNLVARMDRLANMKPRPLFIDVTWTLDAGKRSFETLVAAQAICAVDVQMHLTCTGITRDTADDLLAEAAQAGIRSILALCGDPLPSANGTHAWQPAPQGFQHAGELVKHIRSKHGGFFSIAVAGHPLGHPRSSSRADELKYLKAKIDAGADYIITQFFFKADDYSGYVRECREAGIMCPIVPGILMIPPSLEALRQVAGHCGVAIPAELVAVLEAAGTDAEAVRVAGSAYMQLVAAAVLAADDPAPGLYIYTMNLEKSAGELVAALRLKGVGELEEEEVRPIFWASNPMSYLARTRAWINNPPQNWQVGLALERPTLFDDEAAAERSADNIASESVRYSYHSIVARRLGSLAERRSMWGESLLSEDDVFDVFERFVRGHVPRLPWCDRIEKETAAGGLLRPLASLNHYGFLTINSQPRVNGASSEDASLGWGPAGGYVYQKAYLEFFCSAQNLEKLLTILSSSTEDTITLQAFNKQGEHRAHRCKDGFSEVGSSAPPGARDRHVMCVTWGVFHGSLVMQPTIVDSSAFEVWKDEAIQLWTSAWGSIYAPNSSSRKVIDSIADTYWHVYMVDNNFVSGDIFKVFAQLLSLDPFAGSPVIRPNKAPAT